MDRIFLILLYHKYLNLYSHIFKYLQEIYGKSEEIAVSCQKNKKIPRRCQVEASLRDLRKTEEDRQGLINTF